MTTQADLVSVKKGDTVHILKESTESGSLQMWCGALQDKHTFYLHSFGIEIFVKHPPRMSAPLCHACWEEIYKRLNSNLRKDT